MTINIGFLTSIILFMLIIFACLIVFTHKLINAVIYMSTFSILSALVFLFLGAPDVALAEVVIGSTISTIVFLIAIKKHRIFVLYIINNYPKNNEILQGLKDIRKKLETYFKEHEIQLHIIDTNDTAGKLMSKEEQKIIFENDETSIKVHTDCENIHTQNIYQLIQQVNYKSNIDVLCENVNYETPYKEEENDKA